MIYIAFLRGINVGGRTVKMERLRALFTELGLTNVRSYIQSGNLFFDSSEIDRQQLTYAIEQHLAEALGYKVPVFLRTVAELEQTLTLDPFKGIEITPDLRLCVVFLAEPVPSSLTLPWRSPREDLEIVGATAREAFVIWYLINGRPPTTQNQMEKALGGKTTTRFFHTATKILEAAKEK